VQQAKQLLSVRIQVQVMSKAGANSRGVLLPSKIFPPATEQHLEHQVSYVKQRTCFMNLRIKQQNLSHSLSHNLHNLKIHSSFQKLIIFFYSLQTHTTQWRKQYSNTRVDIGN
jgi:hypothetical protein